LKPVLRWVWAPIAARPIAPGHHRFAWLYVTAFVSPATGECFWYITDGVSKPLFEALLAAFAEEAGAGRDRIIVLVLDNAGWHTKTNLRIPEGIRLVYLPAYTPELQPAETLWQTVDEPIVNKHIPNLKTLDAIISNRCAYLANDREMLKGRAGFHWWPNIANAS
jgi:transposase